MPSSIDCPLSIAAQKNPNSSAVVWGGRRISYRQFDLYVTAAVRALKERNIRPGDRVVLISDNRVEALIVCWGMWRLGAVVCPVDPKFPADHTRDIIRMLNAGAVIFSRTVMPSPVKGGWSAFEITDLIVFEHKEGGAASEDNRSCMPEDREAAIVLTSGTSAQPKAAVLTFGNMYFNALGSNEAVPLDGGSVWLLSLPLFHVSGLGIVWRCVTAGAAIRVAAKEEVWSLIAEGKVSHVSMVLTQLVRWLSLPEFQCPSQLRAVLLGGGAFPRHVLAEALDKKVPIYLSYGLTEMASQVATGRLISVDEPCARLLSYREMAMSSDGEIYVRGRTLFKGYWSGREVLRPVDDDGWFHTCDLGIMDAKGFLKILGRKDDMFICGGENIHPQEIELDLLKIPVVERAVVVGRDDPEFGHRPVAFIRWKSDAPMLTDTQISEHLSKNLPKFKHPVEYFAWPEHAPSDGHKINRKFFKEWLVHILSRNGGLN